MLSGSSGPQRWPLRGPFCSNHPRAEPQWTVGASPRSAPKRPPPRAHGPIFSSLRRDQGTPSSEAPGPHTPSSHWPHIPPALALCAPRWFRGPEVALRHVQPRRWAALRQHQYTSSRNHKFNNKKEGGKAYPMSYHLRDPLAPGRKDRTLAP